MSHTILLYYKYVTVEDPVTLVAEQRTLCERLGLKGRILIAHEGINGTVEGMPDATEEYIRETTRDARFADMRFKKSEGTGVAFKKLIVRARPEIVATHLGEDDVDPRVTTGTYLSAEELHAWIHSDKEFYIIDMRNDFEYRVGHFEGSILPSAFKNFRDLPKILPEIEHLKNKTVVTVCTGGVRCEKASGFLVKHGFTDVYQLFDGIVTYMEKYPNEDFKGKLYVFDGRITMGFNTDAPEHTVISTCDVCGASSDRFVNCGDVTCHQPFICCESCDPTLDVRCPATRGGCKPKHAQRAISE